MLGILTVAMFEKETPENAVLLTSGYTKLNWYNIISISRLETEHCYLPLTIELGSVCMFKYYNILILGISTFVECI